ncbi:MAG: metallophosphoesterase [Firmicutes bacterium]|nr:metallophosphoesterase [Bacillota bacterium]
MARRRKRKASDYMKIGIISDTHDNILMMKKAVEIFREKKIELLLHAGDHVAPFTCMVWEELGVEVIAVFGNNDGDHSFLRKRFRKIGRIYDRPREIIIGKRRILMLHEPDNLNEYSQSGKYDLVIFGHTHKQKIYLEDETLVINPGEGCGWITGKATAVIIDLKTMDYENLLIGESPLPPLAS